jgi:hypothetical protein
MEKAEPLKKCMKRQGGINEVRVTICGPPRTKLLNHPRNVI